MFGLRCLLLPALQRLQCAVAGLHLAHLGLQLVCFGLQLLALLLGQQLHAIGMGLVFLQRLACIACAFEHGLRNLAVDVGAGEFFQQLGAFVGAGLQKGRKAALGQQHGFGKARKVQPGDLGHLLELFTAVVAEDMAVGHSRQFNLGGLQCTAGLVAGAALAPEGAVGHAFDFELHLGQTVGGVPRHQIIAAGADGGKARRLVVERQADGIEQRGFARPCGASDGKQAVARKGGGAEIDFPFALERVEILEAQLEDFHAAPPEMFSVWLSDSTTLW